MLAAASQFTPYSPSHFAAIAAGIILTTTAIIVGRRVRGTPREQPYRTTLGMLTPLDHILVHDQGGFAEPCLIDEIHALERIARH